MALGEVVLSSLRSCGTVYAIVGLGGLLERQGLMGAEFSRRLARMVIFVFYPVLLFAGAAKVATPGTFRELYFLLPLPVAQIAVGLAVAWLVLGHAVWWRGQPDGVAPHALGRFRRVAMVAVGFPNAVEIPLAILTALTDEWRVGEFADETREESIERGSGYLSVYSVCYNLVLWTTLFDYFVRTGEGEPAPEPGAVVAAPKFGKPVAPPVMDGPRMVAGEEEDDEAPTTPLGRRKSPSAGALETSSSSSSVQVAGAAATATTTTVAEPPGVSARVWEYARRLARLPPLMATVAGVLVGLCAPVRGLLFGGELEWALDILRVIAGGTVPLSMLVVGSSLYRGLAASRDAPTTAAPDADAVTRPRATTRVLVGVAVARLVVAAGVTGALFTVLLSSAGALDLSNKLLVFVTCISPVGPTASAIVMISALTNNFSDELAVCVLWQYFAAMITLYVHRWCARRPPPAAAS